MNPTPPTDLNSLKSDAYTAADTANKLTTDAPGLLNQLKQNLVGIFAKNNPVIDARNNALTDYLSTASQSRADMLPGNMTQVAGRPLTLSPTQQDAITTGRNAAALAPLAGYNEILKGEYGSIGDLLGNAGNIYDATIKGAQGNANNLLGLYKAAIDELQARTQAANAGGVDLSSIMDLISHALGVNKPSLDDIFGTPQGQQASTPTYPPVAPLKQLPTFSAAPAQTKNMPISLPQPSSTNGLSLAGNNPNALSSAIAGLLGGGNNIRF